MKEKAKFALGILVGLLLLALFLRGIHWAEILEALKNANPWLILLGALANMSTFFIRAVRWRYLLRPLRLVGVHTLFSAVCIGFMTISLLPGRVGEFIRAWVLARREGMKTSAVFAPVVVERILDALTILVLFAVFLLFFQFPENVSAEGGEFIAIVKAGSVYGAPAIFIVLAVMVFLILRPQLAPRWTEAVLFFLSDRWRKKCAGIVASFVEGFAVLSRPALLLPVGFWSLFCWLMITLSIWLTLLGFGITLPFTSTFAVVIMVAVGVSLPTPGGVGGYHIAFKACLVYIFAIEENTAVAAILVCHVMAFLPVTLVGAGYAWKEGLSLGAMKSIADDETGAPA
jgi:uncharacterized protein (TIRG00374 family)